MWFNLSHSGESVVVSHDVLVCVSLGTNDIDIFLCAY